ncbi:MAG: glutamate--cysteine ligase [Gammaproteobacteria bacterium]|nr:glutamate--cysteine ligase [Gammaproteobacteria bacterium]
MHAESAALKSKLQTRVERIIQSGAAALLRDLRRGIEKECLRITANGTLSRRRHFAALGSALTHPHITTDYSEALLEFITPPLAGAGDALRFLEQIHVFVYRNIGGEKLWANSMPCLMKDSPIPLAEYGVSNVAKMKHVYRRGLSRRYGGLMQTIAGVHYNFSLPAEFWSACPLRVDPQTADAASVNYFAAVRNVHRYCWLALYLCGASPALCECFAAGRRHGLQHLDDSTIYAPHATCLRMSGLGYQNDAQSAIAVDYNNLQSYTDSLVAATQTPWPAYESIGVKANGDYLQLNANLLQIENEYYSVIRPKQNARSGEKPSSALKKRGVAYLEARFIDLNPYAPAGIALAEARWLEIFLLFCMLQQSPDMGAGERKQTTENTTRVVHRGRCPSLTLSRNAKEVLFRTWAGELLAQMQPVAELLDSAQGGDGYSAALKIQQERVRHPELTLSAQMLDDMLRNKESFFAFTMRKTEEHENFFRAAAMERACEEKFRKLAGQSRRRQREMEKSDSVDFDHYLKTYFAAENPS